MNQKYVLLGLIVAITLGFGAFVVFDLKSKNKLGSSKPGTTNNWKWTDDWTKKDPGASVPLTQNPSAPTQQIVAADYRDALKKSAELGKPVFVFFSADWCQWCGKMKKESLEDPKVKQVMPHYILVIVDTDKDRTGAKKFDVTKLPSYVITNCNEDKLKAENGFKNGSELAEWLNNPSLHNQPKKEIKEVEPSDDIGGEEPEEKPKREERREERRERRNNRQQEMPPGGS